MKHEYLELMHVSRPAPARFQAEAEAQIPHLDDVLTEAEAKFIKKIKTHPHDFGKPSTTPQAPTHKKPSVAAKQKLQNNVVEKSPPQGHLLTDSAQNEEIMHLELVKALPNRPVRKNKEANPAQSRHGFWSTVNKIGNSSIVSGINAIGDTIAEIALDSVNPVKAYRDIKRDAAATIEAYNSGNKLGVVMSGGMTALETVAAIPLVGGIAKGAKYGIKGLSGVAHSFKFFGGKSAHTAEKLMINERITANIAKSRQATESSKFSVLGAKENQLSSGYNMDLWTLDSRMESEIIFGGLPGRSSYYTDLETILASEGDHVSLAEILQVKPHKDYPFRKSIGEYEVVKDFKTPSGRTSANIKNGPGGGQQYYINNPNRLKLIKEHTLKEFYDMQVSRNKYTP